MHGEPPVHLQSRSVEERDCLAEMEPTTTTGAIAFAFD
jgi:hypothetical protein